MDERFMFVGLNAKGQQINNELREKLSDVCKLIESVPSSRQLSLALTNIEQGAMWFTKGLVRTPGFRATDPDPEGTMPEPGTGTVVGPV